MSKNKSRALDKKGVKRTPAVSGFAKEYKILAKILRLFHHLLLVSKSCPKTIGKNQCQPLKCVWIQRCIHTGKQPVPWARVLFSNRTRMQDRNRKLRRPESSPFNIHRCYFRNSVICWTVRRLYPWRSERGCSSVLNHSLPFNKEADETPPLDASSTAVRF